MRRPLAQLPLFADGGLARPARRERAAIYAAVLRLRRGGGARRGAPAANRHLVRGRAVCNAVLIALSERLSA